MSAGAHNHQLDLIPLDENTPRLKVAKSNALIEAQFELSASEHRLLLLAMAQIHKDQSRLVEQVFSIQDIVSHLDLNAKNAYRDLKRISQGLMRKQVEIQGENGQWRLYQWVSKAWCERGMFGIKFSDDLGPFLIGLASRYTLFELGKILSMTSGYAIRLYEIFKQYERFGSRTVCLEPSVMKTKAELHGWGNFPKLMGYNPASYKRFSNLNQRVLQPAIAQVQEYTEFKEVMVKPIRFNRKTVALTFSWHTGNALEDLPRHPLFKDMRSLGIKESVIRNIFESYSEETIARVLKITKDAHRSGSVSNPAGYFVNTLKASGGELLGAVSANQDTEEKSDDIEHPLKHACATEQEFLKLLAAERKLGRPFTSFNEFHEYTLGKFE